MTVHQRNLFNFFITFTTLTLQFARYTSILNTIENIDSENINWTLESGLEFLVKKKKSCPFSFSKPRLKKSKKLVAEYDRNKINFILTTVS